MKKLFYLVALSTLFLVACTEAEHPIPKSGYAEHPIPKGGYVEYPIPENEFIEFPKYSNE